MRETATPSMFICTTLKSAAILNRAKLISSPLRSGQKLNHSGRIVENKRLSTDQKIIAIGCGSNAVDDNGHKFSIRSTVAVIDRVGERISVCLTY